MDCYKVHKVNRWKPGTMVNVREGMDAEEREGGENDITTVSIKSREIVGVEDNPINHQLEGTLNNQQLRGDNPVNNMENEGEEVQVDCSKGHRSFGCENGDQSEEQVMSVGTPREEFEKSSNHGIEGKSAEEGHENASNIQEATVGMIESVEVATDVCMEDSSIDEMLVGHYSCPNQCAETWFDPMASIEYSLSRVDVCSPARNRGDVGQQSKKITKTNTSKRPWGRPKRMGNSLPVPLSVQATPSVCSIEAIETWKVAKLIGATTPNEDAILSELRKSKRIQNLEESNRVRLDV